MKKTKIIIGTRLYAWPIGGYDCVKASSDEKLILNITEIAKKFFIKSMLNQTDLDFTHYTIVNDYADLSIINNVFVQKIELTGFKTNIIRAHEWAPLIKNEIIECKNNNINLAIARTDIDDPIHKNVIKNIKNAGNNLKDQDFLVYGFMNGLHYRLGSNKFRKHNITYSNKGHFSTMQTLLLNTSNFSYKNKIINPYSWDHSNLATFLLKNNISQNDIGKYIINGDIDLNNEPGYIYLRHYNSISTINKEKYDEDSRFPILTDISEEFIFDRFGIKTN
jgi:hypothetical protein